MDFQHRPTRRTFLKAVAGAAVCPTFMKCAQQKKPNVLFIAVDDLRPQLGSYGKSHVISPNIDSLAREGFVAERCFCNVPVCGASRASLLTGVRPTRDRFVTYHTWAEKDLPDNLPLPQYFKQNGYYTISNGKVFHHRTDCAESWSGEPWRPKGDNWRDYVTDKNQEIAAEHDGRALPYEVADVADNAYYDGKIADKTIEDLRMLSNMDQPFFLATGFLKPHLPFNAPKKYWDLYDRDELPMAENNYRPENAPDAAMHNWGELRNYVSIPETGPLTDEYARTLVHGYHACVSYTDAQVGRVLDTLDELGLGDNTIVILWGDHGWNLREHGLWCKHCNFQTSLRAPLIVAAPHYKPARTSRLLEFVDIYPSLCELAGLSVPEHCQGSSFVPLMSAPEREWKEAIFSRYHKGESIRTDRYLYTEWMDNEGSVTARMLYDHVNDPKENVNIAERPEHAELVKELSNMLHAGYKDVLPE